MKDIPDYSKKDEIDLVEILAVFLKRKWIIIIPTVISFIFSFVYVFLNKSNEIVIYKANIVITPPQLYKIRENRLLDSFSPELDGLINKIENELFLLSSSEINGRNVIHFTYDISIIKTQKASEPLNIDVSGDQINIISKIEGKDTINIQITGQKEKIIEAVKSIHPLLADLQNEVTAKNQKIFVQNQEALQDIILQKRELFNTIMSYLEGKLILKLPQGNADVVVGSLITLEDAITDLELIKEQNKSLQLTNGNFAMVTGNKISIIKNNLAGIASYLNREYSKKRLVFVVIAIILLTFIVSLFLAFVIEFFSREDVKRRLKEKTNK